MTPRSGHVYLQFCTHSYFTVISSRKDENATEDTPRVANIANTIMAWMGSGNVFTLDGDGREHPSGPMPGTTRRAVVVVVVVVASLALFFLLWSRDNNDNEVLLVILLLLLLILVLVPVRMLLLVATLGRAPLPVATLLDGLKDAAYGTVKIIHVAARRDVIVVFISSSKILFHA